MGSIGKFELLCPNNPHANKHVLGRGCSRNSEDNTKKYPDIAASVPRLLKPGVRSVVLDCEAVAFDREEGKILPFQASP